MLAFREALDAGAHYLETDVHVSRDGVAVLSHDPDLRRLAGSSRSVAELTTAELAAVDLGHDQGFCTLQQALEAFPDVRFNIDVKIAGAIEPTVRVVRETGALDRVLVGSFDEQRRSQAVGALPGVATSASSRLVFKAFAAMRARLAGATRRILAAVDAVQVPERFRGIRIVSPASVRAFHAAGVEVHVWTVNDPDTMHRLLDWGVDGIVTDRADLAIEVLSARSGWRSP